MKILLNIESLVPPLSGIGTYTYHLKEGLSRHPDVEDVSVFTRNNLLPAIHLIPGTTLEMLRRLPFVYELREQVAKRLLRRAKSAHRGYVYHETNYVAVPYDGPFVVTVSDLSHVHFPEYHPPERVRWLNRHLARSVAEANQVICHSTYTRAELIGIFGLPAEKVNVVYCGASDAFQPRLDVELQPVMNRYGLTSHGYLLSVGTLEPRKNLIGLIRAYRTLPAKTRQRFPLVLAGPRGWLTDSIEQAMAPLIEEGTLRWLGYVPIEDLPSLYAGASAFAFLSFYEGFGLPVIEAMSCGVPMLVSDRASLPEIAGGAALLVDPDAEDAVAEGLRRILEDSPLRESLVAKGLQQASRFRWETCVNETVAVYEKALRPH